MSQEIGSKLLTFAITAILLIRSGSIDKGTFPMHIRLCLLLCGLIAGACATSSGQVVKTYELAGAAVTPISRILVVGAHEDRSVRRQFEDTLADSLRAGETDAVSSIVVMPRGEELDQETVATAAKEARADAVLITRLKDVQLSATLEEGRTTTEARRQDDGDMLDFFRYDYIEHEDPLNVTTVRTVVVSSELYRVADRLKLWSVESTAVDKENAMDAIETIAASTTRQLRRDGLVR